MTLAEVPLASTIAAGSKELLRLPYRIIYSPAAEEHLRGLTARQRATILDGVEEQLLHQPTVETRNRKPMWTNRVAPCELRIGALRVYYDVEEQPEPIVAVQAVGVKRGNQVFIGGKAIEQSRARLAAEGGISADEMRRRLGLEKRARKEPRAG